MYGGASSCREYLDSSSELAQEPLKVIHVRPVVAHASRDTMGTTARKILDALEKFSTPVYYRHGYNLCMFVDLWKL